jgi:hypothetical protein
MNIQMLLYGLGPMLGIGALCIFIPKLLAKKKHVLRAVHKVKQKNLTDSVKDIQKSQVAVVAKVHRQEALSVEVQEKIKVAVEKANAEVDLILKQSGTTSASSMRDTLLEEW